MDNDTEEFTNTSSQHQQTNQPVNHLNKKEIRTAQSNKLTSSNSSSKSTTKSIRIKIAKPQYNHNLDDCSYDSLLQSYSDEANLCSTPEIRDIYMPTSSYEFKKIKDAKTQDQLPGMFTLFRFY